MTGLFEAHAGIVLVADAPRAPAEDPALMTTSTTTDTSVRPRELAVRTADRITVALLWRPGDPGVLLQVDDARTGVRFEREVPGRDALEAYHHPFAYAA
jgi:hypothetical protein